MTTALRADAGTRLDAGIAGPGALPAHRTSQLRQDDMRMHGRARVSGKVMPATRHPRSRLSAAGVQRRWRWRCPPEVVPTGSRTLSKSKSFEIPGGMTFGCRN